MRKANKLKTSMHSLIAMLLCISMLLGTTMAWFNDQVTNQNNRVEAGTLGVQLLKYNSTSSEYEDISDGEGDIFSEKTGTGVNWEPGKTEVVLLAVKNSEEMALNYNIILEVSNETGTLAPYLQYAILSKVDAAAYAESSIETWEDILAVEGVESGVIPEGETLAAPNGALTKGAVDYFALAVHMDEAAGNDLMGAAITIDVRVVAKQMTYESDSFGSSYDANAEMPIEEIWVDILEGVGDFETDPAANWPVWRVDGTYGTATFVQDENAAASGETYLRLSDGGQASGIARVQHVAATNGSVRVVAGETYKLTGWVKQEGNVVPRVKIFLGDDYYDYFPTTQYNPDNVPVGEWQYFEIPLSYKVDTWVFLRLDNEDYKNAGDICFDGLQLLRKMSETDLYVMNWADKLADEAATSQMVVEEYESPYVEKEPLPGQTNLVANGTFDTDSTMVLMNNEGLTGNTIDGWTCNFNPAGSGYTKVEITAEGTYKGSNPAGYNDPTIRSRAVCGLRQFNITDLIPGAQYQIKFDYKMEKSSSGRDTFVGPYAAVVTYSEPKPGQEKNTLDEHYVFPCNSGLLQEDGQWHTYSETFNISTQVYSMDFVICMWLYENDVIEIDNVYLYAVDLDAEIALDTDQKFYYSDLENGTFTVDLSEEMFPDIAADTGIYVDIEVFDGEDKVWEQKNLTLDANDGYKAEATFPLDKMTKLGSPYVVKATLYGSDGEMICEVSDDIFKYDRPTYMDANGNYTKPDLNGEELNMNLGYATAYEHFDEAQEVGCNVMSLAFSQSAEHVLNMLDICERNGVMGMLNMNFSNVGGELQDKIWKMIDVVSDERVRNHPALFGYNVMDEPWGYGTSDDVQDWLEQAYRIIRQYDKDNVIFLTDNTYKTQRDSAKHGDAIMIDPYYAAAGANVYQYTTNAVNVAGGKPVWTIVEAYKNLGRILSADEVRNNVWQAMIGGAKGMGYYAISAADYAEDGSTIPIWEMTSTTDTDTGAQMWEGMKSWYEKESDIAFNHFVHNRGTRIAEEISLDDGYIYSAWTVDGKTYLVVLNVKGEEVTVNIDLASAGITDYSATVINGSTQADFTGNGTVTVTLEKDQAVLYEITSATTD